MNEGQELVAETKVLSVFDKFECELVEFEKVNEMVTFDLDTFEGEEDCKKHVKNIGKLRIGVEKLRKSTKKEFVDGGNAVDKEAKIWQARIAAIDAVHSVPLKALETKRINEVLAEQEAIKAEAKRIQDEKDAELEKLRGIVAKQEADAKAIEDAAQAVRGAAERKDELEAAALLAAENATFEAGQRAIEEVAAVKRQAKAEAAALAQEIADKYEAEQAEQCKINAGILARQQDVKHRKDFNNKAVRGLDNITGSHELSMTIVKAIVKGEVPNVTMNY